jgi:hypothetical protein
LGYPSPVLGAVGQFSFSRQVDTSAGNALLKYHHEGPGVDSRHPGIQLTWPFNRRSELGLPSRQGPLATTWLASKELIPQHILMIFTLPKPEAGLDLLSKAKARIWPRLKLVSTFLYMPCSLGRGTR